MNLNRTSCSSTVAVPVDLLGAPWVDEEGGDLASHCYRARYYCQRSLKIDPLRSSTIDPPGLIVSHSDTGTATEFSLGPAGLWKVPGLWKTAGGRFPTAPWKTLRVSHVVGRGSGAFAGIRRVLRISARG